jgi:hypothetical protein
MYIRNKLVEQVEEGLINWEEIAQAALCYMSTDDLEDMAQAEDLIFEDEEEG